MLLESKQCQAHIRKYEVLSQEVQHLKELERKPSHVRGQAKKAAVETKVHGLLQQCTVKKVKDILACLVRLLDSTDKLLYV